VQLIAAKASWLTEGGKEFKETFSREDDESLLFLYHIVRLNSSLYTFRLEPQAISCSSTNACKIPPAPLLFTIFLFHQATNTENVGIPQSGRLIDSGRRVGSDISLVIVYTGKFPPVS
jgi:hypothetical protein